MRLVSLSLALIAGLLTGCSTITTGTTQSIFINTPKMAGAQCSLTDSDLGKWTLLQTPGAVIVDKGDGPMTIKCQAKGYADGSVVIDETLVGATLGNIILGGGIGFIVDAANGSAQKYPDTATVWMKPNKFPSSTAATAWQRDKVEFEIADVMKSVQEKCDDGDCQALAHKAGLNACQAGGGVVDCKTHALLRK